MTLKLLITRWSVNKFWHEIPCCQQYLTIYWIECIGESLHGLTQHGNRETFSYRKRKNTDTFFLEERAFLRASIVCSNQNMPLLPIGRQRHLKSLLAPRETTDFMQDRIQGNRIQQILPIQSIISVHNLGERKYCEGAQFRSTFRLLFDLTLGSSGVYCNY